MAIDAMRKEYEKGALVEERAGSDPIDLFRRWFDEAVAANEGAPFEPNAMTLSTIDPRGDPRGRIVLLKGFDAEGFVFYTNYASAKGRELAGNARAALTFYWSWLERQVRIVGDVTRVSEAESEAYFRTRPRGSQLGALVSNQSDVVPDRAALERRLSELEKQYEGRDVPRPATWGGYRVAPRAIEFWQGRRNRLHDRLLYRRAGDGWERVRLAP